LVRLFVGLKVPQLYQERLHHLCYGIEGARWVEPQNFHITLRFIGDVDEDIAENALNALDLVHGEPFALKLNGLGTFGRPPRALWVGVQDLSRGSLVALQANVESAMVRTGLKPEGRKYTPHMTLARFKNVPELHLANFIESHGALALEPIDVEGFTLFQSHLTHTGAQYEIIKEFEFGP